MAAQQDVVRTCRFSRDCGDLIEEIELPLGMQECIGFIQQSQAIAVFEYLGDGKNINRLELAITEMVQLGKASMPNSISVGSPAFAARLWEAKPSPFELKALGTSSISA